MSRQFGATSTTDEVLEGQDLSGIRVLVTGVSAGLGVETARALASRGAKVVGTARDLAKAEHATAQVRADAKAGGGSLELVALDLASLASVRTCADALRARDEPFDLVIANAGVMATPFGHTADGFETQFGTNHLGHFVLVNRIAPLMRPGARLVNLASSGHRYSDVDLDDPNFERTPYEPFVGYGRSKTANILFAVEFDRRHRSRGVRATAVHPGGILTELGRHLDQSFFQVMIDQMNQELAAEGKPPSSSKRPRRERRPRSGQVWSRKPTTWAVATARTAMSAPSCPTISSSAPSAKGCVVTRSIPSVPRRSGRRAKRWWGNGSDRVLNHTPFHS